MLSKVLSGRAAAAAAPLPAVPFPSREPLELPTSRRDPRIDREFLGPFPRAHPLVANQSDALLASSHVLPNTSPRFA